MTGNAGRLQRLFDDALSRSPAERAEFLRESCTSNAELMRELCALLAADERLADMTARRAAPELGAIAAIQTALAAATAPAPSMTGKRVGPFELREELGRGGMGSVYRAERVDGTIDQQVAIKFVRRDMLDVDALRRFQLERKVMASLDHPNIARLYDASELDDGSPYFVMEYVRGLPITDYCARERLGVRERVALLKRVCGAVAEAHRELIVHRDLKPGNILINETGEPKLLDFGIAKPLATGEFAVEPTRTGQRFFSPQYAAPEQLAGTPVGVTCDVYALGLLAYELLTARRPFELAGLSAAETERLILQVPATAPSATLARRDDGTHPVRARELRGDLDGIVLRCLRKDPHERYPSVEQLESELTSYLEGRPVSARGGDRFYRARKFVGRNKLAVTAGALIAASLFAGLVGFASQARIAQQRAAELEQVARFQAEMLDQLDPTAAGVALSADVRAQVGKNLAATAASEDSRAAQLELFERMWSGVSTTDAARNLIDRTLLKPAVTAIEKQFRDQPVVDAALRQVIAERYRELGLLDAAVPLQRRALEVRERILGPRNADTLYSTDAMGVLLLTQGRMDDAEPFLRRALALRRETLGDEHRDTLVSTNNLAHLHERRNEREEADRLYQAALEVGRRVLGEDDRDTLMFQLNVAGRMYERGELEAAERAFREAFEKSSRSAGHDDVQTIYAQHHIGIVMAAAGRYDEAERLFRDVAERRRRVLGDEHPDTAYALYTVGDILRRQGRGADAEPFVAETLRIRRRVLGDDHPDTITTIDAVGQVLTMQGRLLDAEPYYRDAVERARRILGPDHAITLQALNNLGGTLRDTNQLAEAEPMLRETYDGYRRLFGDEHRFTLIAMTNLGTLLHARKQYDESVRLLAPHEDAVRRIFTGDNMHRVARFLAARGDSRKGLGEFDAAERDLLEACALLEQSKQARPMELPNCVNSVVQLYDAWTRLQPQGDAAAKAAPWRTRLSALVAAGRTPTNL